MADVNEVFGDITNNQSYFNPNEKKKKKKYTPYTRGEYLCHIIESESKVVDVAGGKHRAELFTYTVEVADENKTQDFQYRDINGAMTDTKGDVYVGYKFRGKLWRFLEPGEKDKFSSNSSGNTNYMRFCETIGIEKVMEKKEINGEVIEVQLLPSLSSGEMLGKAVIAFVDKGRPWKDKEGKTRQFWDCKFCKSWKDGKDKKVGEGNDAIPF